MGRPTRHTTGVKARERDVLVSLNTGSGKMMLGVLIAQGLSNEKQGKVVYACSTIDLVMQTEKEARHNALDLLPGQLQ